MLIKPDLKDEVIVDCLHHAYGLNVDQIFFMPLGADLNTAVYRITTYKDVDYFLKLRQGAFHEVSVLVPNHLAHLDFKHVIAPLPTERGQLWTSLAAFKAILYPYVAGHHGMEAKLSDQQWIEFGGIIKKFHSIDFPSEITKSVQREPFPSTWRQGVKKLLNHIQETVFCEPIAAEMALFLKSKSKNIYKLIKCAEQLARVLSKQPLEYILCHADMHGWNLLIDKKDALYLVDWDTLIFAPKERDLMFIGAGIGDTGRTSLQEESLFYQGYGQTNINQDAIVYYRCERIIEDICADCEHILSNESDEARRQSLAYLKSNFLPDGTIERAFNSLYIKKQ